MDPIPMLVEAFLVNDFIPILLPSMFTWVLARELEPLTVFTNTPIVNLVILKQFENYILNTKVE